MSNTASALAAVEPAYLAGAIGMASGVLGVSVAIYLQLLAEDYCPPIYVAEFFVFGSALVLVNVAIVNQQLSAIGNWLPVLGNLALLVGELYAIRYVSHRINIAASISDLGAAIDETK